MGDFARVGYARLGTVPATFASTSHAVTRSNPSTSPVSGPAPVRAYIEDLLPDVLEGRIEPGRVFDRVGSIEDVPDGYRAMNDRDVLKFQIKL